MREKFENFPLDKKDNQIKANEIDNELAEKQTDELTDAQVQDLAKYFEISIEGKDQTQIRKEIDTEVDRFFTSEKGKQVQSLVEQRTNGLMSRLGKSRLLKMLLLIGSLAAFELAPTKVSFAQENIKSEERGEKEVKSISRLLNLISEKKRLEIEKDVMAQIDVILAQNYRSDVERSIIKELLIKQIDSYIINSAKSIIAEAQRSYGTSDLEGYEYYSSLDNKYRNEVMPTVTGLLKGGLKITTEQSGLETTYNVEGEQIIERKDIEEAARVLDSFFRVIDKKDNLENIIKTAGGFDSKVAKNIKKILLESYKRYYSNE